MAWFIPEWCNPCCAGDACWVNGNACLSSENKVLPRSARHPIDRPSIRSCFSVRAQHATPTWVHHHNPHPYTCCILIIEHGGALSCACPSWQKNNRKYLKNSEWYTAPVHLDQRTIKSILEHPNGTNIIEKWDGLDYTSSIQVFKVLGKGFHKIWSTRLCTHIQGWTPSWRQWNFELVRPPHLGFLTLFQVLHFDPLQF